MLTTEQRSASPKDVVTEADLVNELDSMALSSSCVMSASLPLSVTGQVRSEKS